VLFVGTFPQFRGFEPSGLMGVGDTKAVYELTRSLTLIGVRLEIAYSSSLEDRQLEKDLILIGGGDSNGIFKRVEKEGRISFSFRHDPQMIYDLKEGTQYHAQTIEMDLTEANDTALERVNIFERDGKSVAGLVVTDYGILARIQNPFNQHRKLVMIAGLFGYGTWGGARLLADEEFLEKCSQLNSDEFECLYKVDILQDVPIAVQPVILRTLP
jgi:hypothetical protein